MDELNIIERPDLRKPVLIAAWSGWNDAAESATSALRFMVRRWRPTTIAEIDPEPFYDFTQARPRVRMEKGERVLEWPPNRFTASRREDLDFDVIMFEATEPHLAWGSYMEAVLEVCRTFDVSALVTLGALLSEVSHTRPVTARGSSTDPDLRQRMGLNDGSVSRYEGPTGIAGAFTQAAREAGIPTASLWASLPVYLNASPNPKGALALLLQLNSGLGLDLSLHDLEVFCARFDAQIASAVSDDPQMAEYARRVEEQLEGEPPEEPRSDASQDDELPDASAVVDELERFLREQQGSS